MEGEADFLVFVLVFGLQAAFVVADVLEFDNIFVIRKFSCVSVMDVPFAFEQVCGFGVLGEEEFEIDRRGLGSGDHRWIGAVCSHSCVVVLDNQIINKGAENSCVESLVVLVFDVGWEALEGNHGETAVRCICDRSQVWEQRVAIQDFKMRLGWVFWPVPSV